MSLNLGKLAVRRLVFVLALMGMAYYFGLIPGQEGNRPALKTLPVSVLEKVELRERNREELPAGWLGYDVYVEPDAYGRLSPEQARELLEYYAELKKGDGSRNLRLVLKVAAPAGSKSFEAMILDRRSRKQAE